MVIHIVETNQILICDKFSVLISSKSAIIKIKKPICANISVPECFDLGCRHIKFLKISLSGRATSQGARPLLLFQSLI